MVKSISVVIPNYNGKELLERNLPPLFIALKNVQAKNEIIIVDDASTDQSVDFLESSYPDIIVLRQSTNRGFSPTVNRGINYASNDLIFLMNSDVELTENYFFLWRNILRDQIHLVLQVEQLG